MEQMTISNRTKQLVEEGLHLVEEKYGLQSINYLPYHNVEHTRDVMEAAERIGRFALSQNKITESELELLVLAACYHDAEHGMHGSENEHESIRIVTEKMLQTGAFSDEDIAKVIAMIRATIVVSVQDGIVQSATEAYVTKIIADADLSNFGKPFEEFWDRSKKYQLEYSGILFENLSPTERAQFIDSQIHVLQKHSYYTSEADQLYGNIPQNIAALKTPIVLLKLAIHT